MFCTFIYNKAVGHAVTKPIYVCHILRYIVLLYALCLLMTSVILKEHLL